MEPVAVGLVGAGPWAEQAHAPMLSRGPHTRLAGVWARRPEAAARLGAPVFERIEELFDACEAVAFCVPPAVQAELGVRAARAGKALLLEKPLADSLDGARRLAEAVAEAGVASQMVLTMRYAAATRAFLARCREIRPFGGHAANISGVLLGDHPFATPWRLERGALLDVGPHVVDLLDAALGRVTGVRAHGDPLGWTGLLLEHEGGAVSEASLCMVAAGDPPPSTFAAYGRTGSAVLGRFDDDPMVTLVAEFAETVRAGGGHPLDAAHGLRIQEIIAGAEAQLAP
ncbi:gfo/Idh/MocA family oxidoreductase [Nonomuraea phyllanthi]|uniref:Gfo/Idh/MocA family oxidoreductase n=1 Tax=Nonomuraea phyllanthi TaxID=2219224 RepID=A0A5C4WBP9_9ACTN|nr:Gfo/Idh/MocA family oxidoreductase [Nonomuraea phyllanthi]KAB8192617.1 gfo/Idh/MocA family oxidoreductase [Nonomuraea phyllanthi]QFY08094.1 gfo/Idh/MocA family oxidoreductase [Nonomuraea phyllanthi]